MALPGEAKISREARYLEYVLERIAEHPINRIEELPGTCLTSLISHARNTPPEPMSKPAR